MKKIVLVEDDKLFHKAIADTLKKSGYEVLSGFNCREGKKLIKQDPDMMLLDMNLPDGSGIDICQQATDYSRIPVIFLTARDEEIDMIKAFDAGCDDYMVKPFPVSVLIKRIEAVFRRLAGEKDIFVYKGLAIDYESKKVSVDDKEVKLTAKEFQLLAYLAKNKGQVLTKDNILEALWDIDGMFVEANTISVTINRLRKKIEPDPSKPAFVRNVFGMGYTFGE